MGQHVLRREFLKRLKVRQKPHSPTSLKPKKTLTDGHESQGENSLGCQRDVETMLLSKHLLGAIITSKIEKNVN
ncbi:hypothetical protein L596_021940 [Steinernema carpocapsae]|uniref:Uncharacterized protein n=1 Tax=Steinernema carpocapsae TaxID=34508 RepID=A0A4U5MK85_STECR|nr:hypothetical protein L596_021940 [Steinernema carpocapsae]